MKHEIVTKRINCLDSMPNSSGTDAPSTFLMPISFVRCSATNEAMPNSPRQEMKMASTANIVDNFPIRTSSANFNAYSSSANL